MQFENRLHVWESPLLHGKLASDPPVEVVYETHEYDFWNASPTTGELSIGKNKQRVDESGRPYQISITHTVIKASGWVKAHEEFVPIEDPVFDGKPQADPSDDRETDTGTGEPDQNISFADGDTIIHEIISPPYDGSRPILIQTGVTPEPLIKPLPPALFQEESPYRLSVDETEAFNTKRLPLVLPDDREIEFIARQPAADSTQDYTRGSLLGLNDVTLLDMPPISETIRPRTLTEIVELTGDIHGGVPPKPFPDLVTDELPTDDSNGGRPSHRK